MKLKVIHAAIDVSLKVNSFTSDATEFSLATEKIHIGFHKPLKNIYVELEPRESDGVTEIEFWNGSTWVKLALEDFTNGLTRPGLISWEEIDQVETSHLSFGKMYWLRLTTTELPALVEINGINLVLSNDRDLSFVPNLYEYLPSGLSSFIGFHQEARDLIVQTIRNSGKRILRYDPDGETLNDVSTRLVDVFDLLKVEEFRNASKYLALHLIYDYLSKSDDDSYRQKSDRFFAKYTDTMNTNLMTIDENDNGETDEAENQAVQFIRIRRE